jgi:hypothetical protein
MIERNNFLAITDQYGYPAPDFERNTAQCSDVCVYDPFGRPFLCLKHSTGNVEFINWEHDRVDIIKTNRELCKFLVGAHRIFKREMLKRKIDRINKDF